MRHAAFFLTVFSVQPPRRTTACGRCGDSFTGDPADGRAWLRDHAASDHSGRVHRVEPRTGRVLPARQPLPAATLSASTSRP
jgi:hypothetical protein